MSEYGYADEKRDGSALLQRHQHSAYVKTRFGYNNSLYIGRLRIKRLNVSLFYSLYKMCFLFRMSKDKVNILI